MHHGACDLRGGGFSLLGWTPGNRYFESSCASHAERSPMPLLLDRKPQALPQGLTNQDTIGAL